ncbi:MAG: hypothetical protein ABI670_05440 [Chloroflexota bacterium]
MDALRRIRPRSAGNKSNARRVSIDTVAERNARLRGADQAMASALEQLRSGVPLNWGQVEDDPELATLARLQQAGEECRLMPLRVMSAEAKEALLDQLSGRIKVRQRPAKPEKVAPKTLAGFSENVQVLTQVEENVAIAVNWPRTILSGVLVVGAVVLAVWGIFSLLKSSSSPTFSWIELHSGDTVLNRQQRVAGWDDLPCRVARQQNPTRPGYFVPVQSLRDAQASVDYNIPLLPEGISVPSKYTFQIELAAVDPCEGNTIKPSDSGALVSLQYQAAHTLAATTPGQGTVGRPTSARPGTGPLTMLASFDQPTVFDVSKGSWKEVRLPQAHGIYWRGSTYRDQTGVQWVDDVSVLLLEHDDQIVTIVGSNRDGITEEMLLEAARNISW